MILNYISEDDGRQGDYAKIALEHHPENKRTSN